MQDLNSQSYFKILADTLCLESLVLLIGKQVLEAKFEYAKPKCFWLKVFLNHFLSVQCFHHIAIF